VPILHVLGHKWNSALGDDDILSSPQREREIYSDWPK